MSAIRTYTLHATNTKGTRVVAVASNGRRLMLAYEHSLSAQGNSRRAASRLAERLGWGNPLVGGGWLPGVGFVWVAIGADEIAGILAADAIERRQLASLGVTS